jgi:hypothetical protein
MKQRFAFRACPLAEVRGHRPELFLVDKRSCLCGLFGEGRDHASRLGGFLMHGRIGERRRGRVVKQKVQPRGNLVETIDGLHSNRNGT